jgi:hypothetical protein
MTAAGILGMLISLLFKRNRQALLILYVIFYYWVISRSSQDAERLVLPIIPILLMFSASVIAEIKNSIIAVLLSTLFIWPSAEGIYYSDSLFLKKDTRTLAYEWIKQNLKKDSKIALDASASGFPRLERSKEQIKELINYPLRPQFARPDRSQEIKLNFMLNNPSYPEKGYYLFYLKEDTHRGFLSSQPGIDIDYKSLKQYKIEYIVLSNLLLDRRYEKFAEDIEDRGTLVKTFSPYREGAKRVMPNERSTIPCAAFMLDELKARQRYGPVIRIYKII